MLDDAMKILASAAVVGPQEVIQLPAASTKIPGQDIPSGTMEGGGHSLHGGIGGVPLEPMGDDDEGLRAMIAIPIQIEKVAVGSGDAFPLPGDRGNPPEEHGQDRLEMAASTSRAQSPWWTVGGGWEQGHRALQ